MTHRKYFPVQTDMHRRGRTARVVSQVKAPRLCMCFRRTGCCDGEASVDRMTEQIYFKG